ASAGLCAGTDPMAAGSYDSGISYYNGSSFYFGTLTSPVITTRQEITTVISSWDAVTPTGTWLEVHVRTLQNGSWTHWYDLPIWASDFSTIHRHSVDGQYDDGGSVATDTYYTGNVNATAYQLSYTLFTTSPSTSLTIRRISAIASFDVTDSSQYPVIAPDKSAWGIDLPVPQRSQNLTQYTGLGFGGGGEVWCSPTSTSMVAAYWSNLLHDPSLNENVPDTARDVYDYTYDGTGNWPFNTAYTGGHGLRTFVTRMYSLSQIEQWIKVGVPVVISIAFGSGQLPGATYSTGGHLMVVRGFTSNGDVIADDPAMGGTTSDAGVRIVYPRAIFQSLWLNASNGTVYINYPELWPTPTKDASGSWSGNF
ncbi:MAG: C39 family peptidase, partial [Ktedonobacteraceae bacterium]